MIILEYLIYSSIRILLSLLKHPLSLFIAIIFIFLLSLCVYLFPLKSAAAPIFIFIFCLLLKDKLYSGSIQGIATLLGIGGTFIGIIIALAGLEIDNFEESIPQLLNGIYPAFFSSLAGVAFSCWIYLDPKYWKHKAEAIYSDSNINSQILSELQTLNSNIVGDSGKSLDAQILQLQDAVTEKQTELKESFDTFAKKMAENNMNALKEVIEQFNSQLQEQFGENFKQLNEAIGKILTWQDNYKDTLDITNAELRNMLAALESSKQSMKSSANALDVITQSTNSFKENADALKTQLEEMRNNIGGISDFSKELNGAADNIKDNMAAIMEKTLEDLGQNLKGISEALVRDYKEVQAAIGVMKELHEKDEQ